ncbi:MAG: phosphate ABC transporter permease subunit PstC, partial [Candidatus Competibacteraceae bacterium]|nr:phosphate ABC transporter permease subunit PstC [Candidatus Competibacteraceae bacterium]
MLSYLLIILLILTTIGYFLGRSRSVAVASGHVKDLHSLPSYYGFYTALWCALPALIVFSLWISLSPSIITQLVVAGLPQDVRQVSEAELNLLLNNIKNMVSGNIVSSSPDPVMTAAAERYTHLQTISTAALWVAVLVL